MSSSKEKQVVDSRAILQRPGDRCLIVRPNSDEDCPWEFPGGPIRAGESPEAGLRRVVREQLGVAIDIVQGQPPVSFGSGTHQVIYRYYLCGVTNAEPAAVGVAQLRWVLRKQLIEYDFPAAFRPIVEWLMED